MIRKRRSFCVPAVLLAAGSLTAFLSVNAYLTDNVRAENRLSVGKNNVEVQETFSPPPDVRPGQVTVKNVTVKNTEGVECYVRVKVRFTREDILPYLNIDYNTTEWVYNAGENSYYYRNSLAENETTKPLFTKVAVKSGVTQDQIDEVGDFDVIVSVESIQKGDAGSYTQAWAKLTENKDRS